MTWRGPSYHAALSYVGTNHIAQGAQREPYNLRPEVPKQRWRASTGTLISRPCPVLVGYPDLLPPVRPEKKDKGTKEKKHSVRPASGPPPPSLSSDADTNSASASLSLPLQSPRPPKACLPVSRAPLRPALFVVVKATRTPISAS